MRPPHAGLAMLIALPAPAFAGTITLDVTGIRQGTGDLYVSLQRQDEFMRPTGSYGEVVARPAPGARTVVLRDVAPGTYAVSVWHDQDGDRQWDGPETGAADPDGWAMVNGDKLRAAPTFAQVSFVVGDAPQTLKLPVRYGYGR